MLNRPIPKSSKLGALGIVMLLVIAAVLLPMARAVEPPLEAREPLEDPVAASSTAAATELASENKAQATTALFQAIRNKDLKLLKSAIADGADVNSRNGDRQTPLHCALLAAGGRRLDDTIRTLVELGANINARNGKDQTPLHLVGERRNGQKAKFVVITTPLIGFLILNGADVNARDNEGRTPVMNAFATADIVAFEQLIANGADVPDDLMAAYKGDFARIQTLIRNGEARKSFGQGITLLHAAVAGGHAEIVELLLTDGSDLLAKTDRLCTALNFAIGANQKEMVELLYAKGVDVNSGGLTPLRHAVLNQGVGMKRCNEMVELLLLKGANPNADGALIWAVWTWATKVAHTIVIHGGDIHDDSRGYTPLSESIRQGQPAMVEVLRFGAGEIGIEGITPLHAAAWAGDTQKVEELINSGANVNAKTERTGRTPLKYAVQAGHPGIVELLTTAGADVNCMDKAGDTPLCRASFAGNTQIMELLLNAGADVHAKGSLNAPIVRTAYRGQTDAARILLAHGADINARDDNKNTLAHLGAGRGHIEFVKYLISISANVNAKTTEGKTPLDLAKRGGNIGIVKLLREHGAKE